MDAEELRRQAEKRLGQKGDTTYQAPITGDSMRLLHELQVHQIELELQNAELLRAREETDLLLEKYTDLYDFAPVGYFSLDKTGIITSVNLAGAHLLGLERGRLHNKRFSHLVLPAKRAEFEAFLKKARSVPAKTTCATTIQKTDKSFLSVEIQAICLETGQDCRLVVIDRSELHQAKQELRQVQKHKMEAIGYLAGGIAHNFNNNLSIILGNIELAQLKRPADSVLKPLLENARIAVLRSRDLVKQIMTYSRGGLHSKATMQLQPILNETVSLLRSTLPTTIDLQVEISPECKSAFIAGDASQIQEMLLNLSNNAVHAMKNKGVLKIFLEPVELNLLDIPAQSEATPGRYVKLSITDTGCGIPTETQSKIFDPFFTTKGEHHGAGMGLATVQGIISQHQGVITVDSVPGQGTSFYLYFPMVESTATGPTLKKTTIQKGNERILFVDDDEMLAELGEMQLREGGYQVCAMTESTEALKHFSENADNIDLLITDQTMPGMTGEELIRKVKKIKPGLPTIICTGFSSEIDEVKASELGIDAFLMKPVALTKLLQTVRWVQDKATDK